MITKKEGMWVSLIKVRYGEVCGVGRLENQQQVGGRGSIWWRDLLRLKEAESIKPGWFSSAVQRSLGCGSEILFWKDKWIGRESLDILFPRLFQVSSQRDSTVSDMGEWRNGSWCWRLTCQRNLLLWETEVCNSLMQLLSSTSVCNDKMDGWSWSGEPTGTFSVKSGYMAITSDVSSLDKHFFTPFWNKLTPLKVAVF